MIGTGEAVGAAVFAATVGIEAEGERDVWAVVFGEQGLGSVDKKLGARVRTFVGIGRERVGVVGIGREDERLETIRWIGVRAAAVDREGGIGCGH